VARCAGVRACKHDARVESARTAAKRVERKSGGHVGGIREYIGLVQREAEQRKHALRAVEKREPLFGFERDSGKGGLL